jgi:hypothetical protein
MPRRSAPFGRDDHAGIFPPICVEHPPMAHGSPPTLLPTLSS